VKAFPWLMVLLPIGLASSLANAQDQPGPSNPGITVEVSPRTVEAQAGEQLAFTVAVKDASGKPLDASQIIWFAVPDDIAGAEQTGKVTFYEPGVAKVMAVVQGQVGFSTVTVKPPAVTAVEIQPPAGPLVVGGTVKLEATPRTQRGNPRQDVEVGWTSESPSIARVDAAGLVTGVAPGKAVLRAAVKGAAGTVTLDVIENPVRSLAIEPSSTRTRTGDVVRLQAQARDAEGSVVRTPFVRWAVSGEGASVGGDGAFVAERPGSYAVTATSGANVATASVLVAPRNVERAIQVVGRGPVTEFQAAEQWATGKHSYLSSVADRVWIYDVSDPSNPVKTDSLVVDARLVNDVSTTADGKIGLLTREGASSRKNGIVFFDAADPAHPKIISEYTETVSGGVHSAFIDGHHVYLTDDATGSMRVIDFSDLKKPREVARWEVENPLAKTMTVGDFQLSAGRSLHDIYVKDGLAYLAYWKDGLVILDVGNGLKGGKPEKPQFVSQLRFNHHELYGPGWLAGTHTVFRYKNYVFVGDEVLPAEFDVSSRDRLVTRGIIHVVDVSAIERPHKVAEYSVPEAGAHNVWVEDDKLYIGFTYGGGGRVLDVSGELRGDLYLQGREIARLWTGDPKGFRPNLAATWGAQPHEGLIFFNDINSGLWIARLGDASPHGSVTAPPH
jgi:hypothetical protein